MNFKKILRILLFDPYTNIVKCFLPSLLKLIIKSLPIYNVYAGGFLFFTIITFNAPKN